MIRNGKEEKTSFSTSAIKGDVVQPTRANRDAKLNPCVLELRNLPGVSQKKVAVFNKSYFSENQVILSVFNIYFVEEGLN